MSGVSLSVAQDLADDPRDLHPAMGCVDGLRLKSERVNRGG